MDIWGIYSIAKIIGSIWSPSDEPPQVPIVPCQQVQIEQHTDLNTACNPEYTTQDENED